MNIAVLSSASAGGAGIAAYRIYEALVESGHTIDFFDMNTIGGVEQHVSPWVSATNKKITNTHYTVDFATEERQWLINLLVKYDFINIQWSSFLISLSEILKLAQLGKKILFTLHDFYYMTGGCHYPAGCLGYLNQCMACPQVDETLCSQLTVMKTLEIKREIFSHPNVHLSAPSAFVVNSAIQSGLIPKNRGHVLRNAYKPIADLDLTLKKQNSILLIADSFAEERKGLALAVQAIKQASKQVIANNQPFSLHLIGNLNKEVLTLLDGTGVEVVCHDHIKEHSKLVDIFSQCQFILTCSYEDNWPNILVESAEYGCIPITGKWHGCEEFIQTFNIGFIAENYTSEEFSKIIEKAFSIATTEQIMLATTLAEKVREMHLYQNVSEAYQKIYQQITASSTKEKAPKLNNKLVSRNHLSMAIRLMYNQKIKKGEVLDCKIKIHPSPFGNQNNIIDDIAIKQLHELYYIDYPQTGYGLKQYLI